MILTPLQKLPKNGEDWGKLIVAKANIFASRRHGFWENGRGHEERVVRIQKGDASQCGAGTGTRTCYR